MVNKTTALTIGLVEEVVVIITVVIKRIREYSPTYSLFLLSSRITLVPGLLLTLALLEQRLWNENLVVRRHRTVKELVLLPAK